jgi:hypothetical protein
MSTSVFVALTGIALAALFLHASRKGGELREEKYQAAAALGFSRETVERDTPVLGDKDPVTYSKDRCDKFVTRALPGRFGDWSLLQRFPEQKDMPNGFLLQADKPSDELAERVRVLAEVFGDDYFEFERRGDALFFYCFEHCGKDRIEKVARAFAVLDGA